MTLQWVRKIKQNNNNIEGKNISIVCCSIVNQWMCKIILKIEWNKK